MAVGDTTDTSVIWNPDSPASGINASGATVAVPADAILVRFGSGAPSGAPNGGPFYVNTATNKLYAYNATSGAWVTVSGFNT